MTEIDLQPTLHGASITLRPLMSEDFEALYMAASDRKIWELHPDPLRYKRDVFEKNFFLGAISSGGALTVLEKASGEIIGCSRYYEWNSDKRAIAIGYTFLERAHWGTGTNKEMKELMLRHIFKQAQIVWFHVGKLNFRSRVAVEKLGAALSHEEIKTANGSSYALLYYKLDEEMYK